MRNLKGGHRIEGVTSNDVPFHVAHIEDWINESCERNGGLTNATLMLRDCLFGQCQLWLIRDRTGEIVAAIVTEIRHYPLKSALHVLAVGGESMVKWASCILEIEAWAASVGCSLSLSNSRPGWAKKAKELGYRTAAYVLSKELTPQEDTNGRVPRQH